MSEATQPRTRTCTRCRATPVYRVRGWGGPNPNPGKYRALRGSDLDEVVCEEHLTAARRDAHRRAYASVEALRDPQHRTNAETTLADPLAMPVPKAVGADATQPSLF